MRTIKASNPTAIVVFTDGSGPDGKAAGGAITDRGATIWGEIHPSKTTHLGKMASVADGERVGVANALQLHPNTGEITILTDSLAALTTTMNLSKGHPSPLSNRKGHSHPSTQKALGGVPNQYLMGQCPHWKHGQRGGGQDSEGGECGRHGKPGSNRGGNESTEQEQDPETFNQGVFRLRKAQVGQPRSCRLHIVPHQQGATI